MNKAEAYAIWATEESEWSRWVKPVLFAYMEGEPQGETEPVSTEIAGSFPLATPASALVCDLPGPSGIFFGLRLAYKGYRPIPLYNALPRPDLTTSPEALQSILSSPFPVYDSRSVVDVKPIIRALRSVTEELRDVRIPALAPPVFLLDSRRRGVGETVHVGTFDNRSAIYQDDFPSAEYLMAKGVRDVTVVQESEKAELDLALVLAGWKARGLKLNYQISGRKWDPRPLKLSSPSPLRRLWFWLQSTLSLQRNPEGGFGAFKHGHGSGG